MVGGFQAEGNLFQGLFQVETNAPLQIGFRTVCQPLQQRSVGFRQAVQDAVHALFHQPFPVQFDLIGGKLTDLPGEGPERLLKKTVDR